ncbi:alpha/beta hydrolase-fold protein [Alistipes sp.]|uniref:alpha/beta hydrolase n=1 Tax=Alistipes sp. TaxID=1872444 RepID=UPI0025C4BF1C|nr:alpha/beta hydrolase-fold protein [Alistipes sp.]MCI7139563.1 esterase family protein [Alistipes sp.]MDY5396313.1 alpha/beta hydrolase-fold protein [Alistipes sp.]
MKKILFILLFLTVSATLRAADIDTLKVFSVKMQREIPTVVVTPDHAEGDRFPVVYLLHGYGGDELAWQRIRDLRPLAEQFSVIFVCPDGENSWYWDSPLDPTSQFETFVSQELPAWVDARYPTLPARESRAIAGLSMGGHGALWTALRHKVLFGAVASVSGGVDIRPFPDSWEMKKQLGEEAGNQERWNRHTVINQVDSLRDGELAIFVDCGYQDFFYDVNMALHEKLLKQGVGHDFLTRPGAHTAEYWAASLPHQLLFFRAYFDRAASK